MRERVPYGKFLVFRIPLLDPTTKAFLTATPTMSAADLFVGSERLIPATPAFKARSFTSGGTAEIRPGDTITGATSAATATVAAIMLTSGSWAGGDAAGSLILVDDSGTFQSENLDTAAQLNIATIAGALGTAGVGVFDNGFLLGAIPGSQMLCRSGWLKLVDATGAEFDDNGFEFDTEDHPLAAYPNGCRYAGVLASVSGTTATLENGEAGITHPKTADEAAIRDKILFIEVAATGEGQAVPVASIDSSRIVSLYEAFPLTPTGSAISYKIYDASRAPAHVVSKISTLDLTTTEKASVNAEVDTALTDYDAPTKAELDSGFAALNDLDATAAQAAAAAALAAYENAFGELEADTIRYAGQATRLTVGGSAPGSPVGNT